ncbi:MAG: hypothetical protein BIFFINMI_01806 [Phycisphaerae bacterium]|nr:hypothetical protein [Phycisphaerae bacterium]
MADASDLISMLARAQRSATMRWLLGMKGFSLMPTSPGEDPMQRLMVRLRTTLEGAVALVVTILTALVSLLTWLLASPAAPFWVLTVGSTVAMFFVIRSMWRSWRVRIPVAGITWVACVVNVAALAGGIAVLAARMPAA